MTFPFYIALRYLFSKKSHNAINIISLVSVCGVALATAALVCALSVMNGFNIIVFSMFGSLDPDLKITAASGKTLDPSSVGIEKLRSLPGIAVVSEVLQDNALIRYNDRQVIGSIKGVDESYKRLTSVDSILVDGSFVLSDEVTDYATLGIGLAASLGINAGFVAPLEIYAPKRNEEVNMSSPSTSFNIEYAYITAVFRTDQQAYDESFMIVPISLARRLFDYEGEVSAVEIGLDKGSSMQAMKKEVRAILGDRYKVSDRYEQQEVSYRMMQSEKWIIFLILCFILVVALFNMVSSLSMLMIEKKGDVRILRAMGAGEGLIGRIFLLEGWMISVAGAVIGIVLGLALCILQEEFGLVRMGVAGTFVIDNYPVRVEPSDIGIILVTVLVTGFLSAWYPVYRIGGRWIRKKRK
ncbi:MAG: FtsX-like permease family protein [Tannerellaceae bacterium]|jgi:ABC-type lipoprotein release transport system permease subunit|nr:FtsX-like permease family protein [Tannerellaceae bacterium]